MHSVITYSLSSYTAAEKLYPTFLSLPVIAVVQFRFLARTVYTALWSSEKEEEKTEADFWNGQKLGHIAIGDDLDSGF